MNLKEKAEYIITRSNTDEVYTIEPLTKSYEAVIFFFPGFDDKVELFIGVWKNIAEEMKMSVKIVLPMLPKYKVPKHYSKQLQDRQVITAWYIFEEVQNKNFKRVPNVVRDNSIIKLVEKEITILEDPEKIAFVGFSMGGRYSSIILNKINKKIAFCLMFKAFPLESLEEFKNFTEEDIKRNQFYLHNSLGDDVIQIDKSLKSADSFRELGFNLKIHVDNEKKHKIDRSCMEYFKQTFSKHFLKGKTKF